MEVKEELVERRKDTAVSLRSGELGAGEDLLIGRQSSCSTSHPTGVVECTGQFPSPLSSPVESEFPRTEKPVLE